MSDADIETLLDHLHQLCSFDFSSDPHTLNSIVSEINTIRAHSRLLQLSQSQTTAHAPIKHQAQIMVLRLQLSEKRLNKHRELIKDLNCDFRTLEARILGIFLLTLGAIVYCYYMKASKEMKAIVEL